MMNKPLLTLSNYMPSKDFPALKSKLRLATTATEPNVKRPSIAAASIQTHPGIVHMYRGEVRGRSIIVHTRRRIKKLFGWCYTG